MIDITKAETRKMTRALTAFILLLSAVIFSGNLEALAHRGLVEAEVRARRHPAVHAQVLDPARVHHAGGAHPVHPQAQLIP